MTGYFKLDSGGAANANHLAVTAESIRTDDGSSVVAAEIIRTDDGSSVAYAFKNASNMAELGAIKEGTGRNTRTDDGSCSNMAELQAIKEGYFKLDSGGAANANPLAGTSDIISTDDGSLVVGAEIMTDDGSSLVVAYDKEGTGGNTRTDDGSSLIVAYTSKNGSNMVLRATKEGFYSGCIVEELPTMRLDVVPGENEERYRKITLDLSQKAEIKRQENMATLIQFQKRSEIPEIKRAQGSVKSLQDIVSRVQGHMESLPSDVVQEIVSRVPAESVLECKLVCKKWGSLVRETNFANMHLSRQLNHLHGGDDGNHSLAAKVEPCIFFASCIDDPGAYKTLLFHGGQVSDRISIGEEYIYNENLKRIYHAPMHSKPLCKHIVGSCNGLVCAFQYHQLIMDPIYICNPLTREYLYLPKLVVKKEDIHPDFLLLIRGEFNMYGNTACGFGYVRSTNEYKVVRMHYLGYGAGNVEVYTLGSGCGWRAIDGVTDRVRMAGGGRGTYVNEAIYWTAGRKIVAFDLAKEEFRSLSGPPCLQNRQNQDKCGLVALGTQLCFYMDKFRMEIWSLMKSSDSKETWCMEFDIDYEAVVGSCKSIFEPILLTRNREIIFLYDRSVLYCYDTKTARLRIISNQASTDYLEDVEAVAHVSTFASMEAMGEPSKRYKVRPRRVRTPWDDVIDELDGVGLGEEIDTTRFRFR